MICTLLAGCQQGGYISIDGGRFIIQSVQCIDGIAGIQCSTADHRLFVDVEIAAVHVVQGEGKIRISGSEIGIAPLQPC